MNKALAHIKSIAVQMADEMDMLDEGRLKKEEYHDIAVNFLLCKFALKIQQANLCIEQSAEAELEEDEENE